MVRAPRVALAVFAICALAILVGLGASIADPTGGSGLFFPDNSPENQTSPTAVPDLNSTERLMLPATNLTTDGGTTSVDPARSTSSGFSKLSAEYDQHQLESRIDSANTSEERVGVLQDELSGIENQLEALHREERAAHQAYVEGDLTGGEFLARLASVHDRSLVLEGRLDHFSDTITDVAAPVIQDDVTSLSGRIAQLHLETRTMQGPVRAEVSDGVRGTPSADHPILVQASEHGHVIATIENGIFTRESFVAPNRDKESRSSFRDENEGRARATAFYPWTFEESVGTQGLLRGDIFRSSVEHPHGTTTMYLDGETELPFRDIHRLDLFRLPTTTVLETSEAGYDVVVDGTYAGGPSRVELLQDGEPVENATVRVDSHELDDFDGGEAWIVAPDQTFELQIETGDATIVLEVEVPVGNLVEA